jgi:hypothetical protein
VEVRTLKDINRNGGDTEFTPAPAAAAPAITTQIQPNSIERKNIIPLVFAFQLAATILNCQ